jgi:hypothetical protein
MKITNLKSISIVFITVGLLFSPVLNPLISSSQAAQSYLTEPTPEFLEEEKRTLNLRKEQLEIRKVWDSIIEEIKSSETPATTEASITKLNKLLQKIDTIPTGVKKLELVKVCRAKKFDGKKVKKTWTKEVEIAYQALIQQFNRQANPKNPVREVTFNFFQISTT